MYLGDNIFFLRKQKKITQEQLAEIMNVSRQTVSRWESNDVIPELNKLVELCELFSCKLDALVRENLSSQKDVYSEIEIRRVLPFTMAGYVMVSPNPEDDVNSYMDKWARNSGLLTMYPDAKRIGWDFPFVSPELHNRFGLRGYAAAYIIPEGFETNYPGVKFIKQLEADYAVITIKNPFKNAFERIPNAYKRIMQYLQVNNFKERHKENVLSCFEYVYKKEEMTFMDVYIHVDGVTKADAFSGFN